jgi:hypothetical protein
MLTQFVNYVNTFLCKLIKYSHKTTIILPI